MPQNCTKYNWNFFVYPFSCLFFSYLPFAAFRFDFGKIKNRVCVFYINFVGMFNVSSPLLYTIGNRDVWIWNCTYQYLEYCRLFSFCYKHGTCFSTFVLARAHVHENIFEWSRTLLNTNTILIACSFLCVPDNGDDDDNDVIDVTAKGGRWRYRCYVENMRVLYTNK